MALKFDDFLKRVYGMHMSSGVKKFLVLCTEDFLKIVDEEIDAKYKHKSIELQESPDGECNSDKRFLKFGALTILFCMDKSVKEGFVIMTNND